MSPTADAPLPRSFLACLPAMWSRVLFPGTLTDSTYWRWPALLTLLGLPGLLLYPCLSFYLFEPDEGRYAEIPREMLLRGEWVVPYLQGEPYFDKPPLLYWLVMLSYRLFGVHDWAARLVPALAVHACVLVVYLVGRHSLGERAAFRAALVLTLTPGLLGVGRLLTMDGLLALWVTLALLCAFEAVRTPVLRRGWAWAAAAACGLGLLTKGPIALVLVLPPLWLHRRLTGTGAPARWRDLCQFAAVALLPALPWYAALTLSNPEFARHFLWEHNIVRFLQPFDHLQPVWYYLPLLLLGMLPVVPLLPPFVRYLGTGEPAAAATRSPPLGFMLLAGGWCVLFFSLSGCKLPTYILPAFPFLALGLGCFLANGSWRDGTAVRTLAVCGLCLQMLGHFVAVPWYAEYRSPLRQWPELAGHCSDPATPVVCYPRMCHSVAFYLGREDIGLFRSKEIDNLRQVLRSCPKTVLLLTHRHSFQALQQALQPEFELTHATHFGLPPPLGFPPSTGQSLARSLGETALGLADLAVVRRRRDGGVEEAENRHRPPLASKRLP